MNRQYLVYSREHNAWWRANSAGYTSNIDEAGRYAKTAAVECCSSRTPEPDGGPPEFLMLAPESIDHIDALEAVIQDFIDKVDRGVARSVDSYAKFKAVLREGETDGGH